MCNWTTIHKYCIISCCTWSNFRANYCIPLLLWGYFFLHYNHSWQRRDTLKHFAQYFVFQSAIIFCYIMERKIISLLAIVFVITESVLCKTIPIEQMEVPSNKRPREENEIRKSEKCDVFELLMIYQVNDNQRNASEPDNKKLLELLSGHHTFGFFM